MDKVPRQCDVILEDEMRNYLIGIEHDRILLSELKDYCENHTRYILALSGLRRTGKTVLMMRQALNLIEAGKNVVYFQITEIDTQQSLFLGVESAVKNGAEYIFIDEVTYVDGFARWADWIYCKTILKGVYCIISGTDSYGLVLASYNKLYDRLQFVKVTYMSYSEFKYITGKTLYEYLHTGGVFGKINVDSYIKTSVVGNIVDSINRYDEFMRSPLVEMEDNELSTAIIKTISQVVIRFILRRLTRPYNYPDMRSAKQQILYHDNDFIIEHEKEIEESIYKKFGLQEDLSRFSNNKIEEFIEFIKFVFIEIDVVTPYDCVFSNSSIKGTKKYTDYILTQPKLRFDQTSVYLEIIEQLEGRRILYEHVIQDMEGQLLEVSIITSVIRNLLGKCIGRSDKMYDIFKFIHDNHEFDMVVLSLERCSLSLFEIKRSNSINEYQRVSLLNTDAIDAVKNESLYRNIGRISKINTVNRYVLYMGEPTEVEGIKYINIEDFLLNDSISNELLSSV